MVIHGCFWLAEIHPLEKPFDFDSNKNGAKLKTTLAKERVKGMYENFPPQAAAEHNSGPPQQTYY